MQLLDLCCMLPGFLLSPCGQLGFPSLERLHLLLQVCQVRPLVLPAGVQRCLCLGTPFLQLMGSLLEGGLAGFKVSHPAAQLLSLMLRGGQLRLQSLKLRLMLRLECLQGICCCLG